MNQGMSPHKSYRWSFLAKAAPGLVKILSYQKSELPHDLVAGLSVALTRPIALLCTTCLIDAACPNVPEV